MKEALTWIAFMSIGVVIAKKWAKSSISQNTQVEGHTSLGVRG